MKGCAHHGPCSTKGQMKVTDFRSNVLKISFIVLKRNSLKRTPNKKENFTSIT